MSNTQAKEAAEKLVQQYMRYQMFPANVGYKMERAFSTEAAKIDLRHQIETAERCYDNWFRDTVILVQMPFKETDIYTNLFQIQTELNNMSK